jgi:Flp pilus assembly protein TadG
MKRLKDESGQALIITALCMTCLFGFAALATDVGLMLREKRLLQIAADSAAIAGALEINYDPANVTPAALAAAGQNGFTATTSGATTAGGTTVTVNKPPLYGPYTGVAHSNYVEVIVSQKHSTLFMSLFGVLNMTPTVRAVAMNGGSSNGCIYVLGPTGASTLDLQGNFDLSAPSCGVVVDSTDPGALSFTGAGGSLTAGSVGVVGGCTGHCGDSTPVPVTGIVAQSDPLGYLIATMPNPTVNPLKATCTVPNAGGKKGAGVLTGTITNAATAIVCYSGNVTLSNVTLNGGTYVFTGNVTLDSTVITNGATLDINSGSLTENTGTVMTLAAPPSDSPSTYHNIAIMAPPANTSNLNFAIGDATGSLTGIIYAPGAAMTLQDGGGSGKKGGLSLTTNLIVKTLSDTAAELTITSYSQTVPGSPLSKVVLVE